MRTTVTLPQGALDNHRRVRLLDHEGAELPVQTQAVSLWPGGSIRVLLVEFTAHLKPNQTRRYTLVYGPEVSPIHESKVRVEHQRQSLVVWAGEMCLHARTDSNFWMDSIRLSGRPFTPPNAGVRGFLRYMTGEAELADMKPTVERVEVAEQGPIQATLVISGSFRHRTAAIPVRLQVRAYHTAYLDITHIIQPPDQEWDKRLQDCGFEIPMAAKSAGRVTFGIEGGDPITLEASRSPALVQTALDKYVVLEHGANEVASGTRCAGWVELSGGGLSAFATVRNAHKLAPVRFAAATYGTSPVLRLALHCSGSPPVKTRHVLIRLEAH
ncbi:MAG: hypothetical protein ACUVRO_10065 [Armatimonadota bacterium]